MENITKEFTYNLADDQYAQTNDNLNTGTLVYNGPSRKFFVVDAETNKLTGATISEIEFQTFNSSNTEVYAVEVNCDSETLICALEPGSINPDDVPNLTEDVPGSNIPYVRDNPALPDHTYEMHEITYDRANRSFIKPFPWKQPYVTWEMKIAIRNVNLFAADRTLTDDLPESLYAQVAEYKQYLRDFTVTFGASWNIVIGNAGTGYSVGDRFLISDPVYKNGHSVSDILLTVSEVGDNGEITSIAKSNTNAYEYHTHAGSYDNVFYTASASGTGAVFNMSKVKTVEPWKITFEEHPLGI